MREDESEGRRHVVVADQLSSAGRYEEAIVWYEHAIAHAPSSCAGYRFVIGELLFELQRYAEARASFERMVTLQPGHAQGWEALGRTCSMLGAHDHAASALERAIALAPQWGEPLYHAAIAYAELGQRVLAEDRLRRAIAIDARFASAAHDDGLM